MSMTETREEMVVCIVRSSSKFVMQCCCSFTDPIHSVSLGVSDIGKAFNYWHGMLQMQVFSRTDSSLVLGFGERQVWCV